MVAMPDTVPTFWLLAAAIAFLLKHLAADFLLQTDWMARGKEAEPDYRGAIAVSVASEGDSLIVTVEDNGIGLPQDRDRIVEPYVTTREKGTGLGLAIVNKIVEEHGGEMIFTPAETGGTRVMLRFARDPLSARAGSEAAE